MSFTVDELESLVNRYECARCKRPSKYLMEVKQIQAYNQSNGIVYEDPRIESRYWCLTCIVLQAYHDRVKPERKGRVYDNRTNVNK
jgi:hypothetical protein